jgi:hypothetical protein
LSPGLEVRSVRTTLPTGRLSMALAEYSLSRNVSISAPLVPTRATVSVASEYLSGLSCCDA